MNDSSPRRNRRDGDPVHVRVPPPRAPRGTELVRLQLADRPGSLARIAGHLATHGVDLLRLEVLASAEGWAIDDLLVSGEGLDDALVEIGAHAIVLARRPGLDLRDPGIVMAAACAGVTAARSGHEALAALVRGALDLVFAEAALLCLAGDGDLLRVAASTEPDLPAMLDTGAASLLASALSTGECLTADGRAPWAPPEWRELLPAGALAAIPGGAPPHHLLLVLLRDDLAPFATAELDRLAALVRVAVGTLRLHEAFGAAGRARLISARARTP